MFSDLHSAGRVRRMHDPAISDHVHAQRSGERSDSQCSDFGVLLFGATLRVYQLYHTIRFFLVWFCSRNEFLGVRCVSYVSFRM